MSTIDLNRPPPNHTFNVSVEPEETTGECGFPLKKWAISVPSAATGGIVGDLVRK